MSFHPLGRASFWPEVGHDAYTECVRSRPVMVEVMIDVWPSGFISLMGGRLANLGPMPACGAVESRLSERPVLYRRGEEEGQPT